MQAEAALAIVMQEVRTAIGKPENPLGGSVEQVHADLAASGDACLGCPHTVPRDVTAPGMPLDYAKLGKEPCCGCGRHYVGAQLQRQELAPGDPVEADPFAHNPGCGGVFFMPAGFKPRACPYCCEVLPA